MRYPMRKAISLVVVLALLWAPAPSLACCDGFWSCAAAVASGGLTCAIEALLNSVKQMKQDVDNLRAKIDDNLKKISEATKGGVLDAGDGLKQAATDARVKYDQALADAQKIQKEVERKQSLAHPAGLPGGALGAAGATTGGATARVPTPKGGTQMIGVGPAPGAAIAGGGSSPGGALRFDQPCSDAEALSSLRRASEQLQKEQKVIVGQVQNAHANADTANKQAVSAADVAKGIAAKALVAPLLDLRGMLDDLILHPGHLFNPAAIVEAAVKRVTDAIGTEFDRMTAAIVADAHKSLEESRLRAQEAEKLAGAASKVANVMGEVQKSQSKANCDKLASLVPAPGTSFTVHLASVQPGLLLASPRTSASALNKVSAGKARATSLATGASSALSTRWGDVKNKQAAALKPTPVPGAEANLKSQTDALYRGLTKTQAAAKKTELLAEARRRFANDPAMLKKMLDLINRESDLRIRALSAPAPVLR